MHKGEVNVTANTQSVRYTCSRPAPRDVVPALARQARERSGCVAARVRHTAFDTAHPAVAALYLAFTLGLTMASLQPVLVAISLAGGFAYSVCADGLRASLARLRWQLPLVLVIAVLNPVFSASGSTELLRIGGRAVYLESLAYGCTMGALFVASALWFQAAATLLPFEKCMALLGNAVPVVSLMISQSMRLIPRFVRQGRQIALVQDAATLPGRRAADAVRGRLRLSSVLMGWTMEDALETADAMRARGWSAARRRTTYARYRFTGADAAALVAIALGGCLCAVISIAATGQYEFYPTMSRLVAWWGYVPYAVWMFVPTALHALEVMRFR